MPVPALLLLALWSQVPAQAAPPVVPVGFTVPQNVADLVRIKRTPKLDGKIEEEEWDPFTATTDSKMYLQWEPGKLFAAATGPTGRDLVVSLDLKGNGWLVGKDNLEVRVSMKEGKTVVSARILDMTNVAGPVWQDAPGFVVSSEAAASSDATQTTYELAIADPGLGWIPPDNAKISARVDMMPSADSAADALLPRKMSLLELADERAAALPAGLKWHAEKNDRPVVPGEGAFMRIAFDGSDTMKLRRLDLRGEGPLKDSTTTKGTPFPPFDRKGRSYVDYDTLIPVDTELGWRVLRGTLTTSDGVPAELESSFRIAPVVDVEIVRPLIPTLGVDRTYKLAYYVRSNSIRPQYGEVKVTLPTGFRLLNGSDVQKFGIPDVRGHYRQGFEIFVPASAKGAYPVKFNILTAGKNLEQTAFVFVGS